MSAWNRTFTEMLRKSYGSFWGNWSLDTSIKPGALGIIDTDTGEFQPLGVLLEGIETEETAISQLWDLQSKGVIKSEGQISAGATTHGVKADFEIKWEFTRENSIMSKFVQDKKVIIKNLTTAIQKHRKTILKHARLANFADKNGNIFQGFGIVSGVIYAKSGLNVGSKSNKKNASFAISGKMDEIKSIIGEAEVTAKYNSVKATDEIDYHISPEKSSITASQNIPIAFTFTSFDNKLPIPFWTGRISELCLTIKNTGSYIVKAKLSYTTEDGSQKEKKETLSGGQTRSFGLPLSSTQVRLFLDYTGTNMDKQLGWGSPIAEWTDGDKKVEVGGFWPNATTLKED